MNSSLPICEVDISGSRKWDIHYDVPQMKITVRNLPEGTLGGWVYLRMAQGGISGQPAERLEQFILELRYHADVWVESYDQIGILVGGMEYRFPFKAQKGANLELDFLQGHPFPIQPPNPLWARFRAAKTPAEQKEAMEAIYAESRGGRRILRTPGAIPKPE
jgi:hypothetical protein